MFCHDIFKCLLQTAHVQYYCQYHGMVTGMPQKTVNTFVNTYILDTHTFNIIVNIMEWLPECKKTVNIFVNTSKLYSHTFNIIVNPTDIDNIIERVRSAIGFFLFILSISSDLT